VSSDPTTPRHDGPEVEEVSTLFRSLAAPLRVALVLELQDGERCVHELVDALQVPQPLVSQHLRVLREANLVGRVRRGREAAYRLTDEHVVHIVRDALTHAGEATGTDPAPAADEDEHHPA
jgi:DNA-binding transcriptional ArsR family regulator